MILKNRNNFEHFYHSDTLGETDDVLLLWVEAKTLVGIETVFFFSFHKAKYALPPVKKNQMHDTFNLYGYLLLGEHFALFIALHYVKVYFLLIMYDFDIMQCCPVN